MDMPHPPALWKSVWPYLYTLWKSRVRFPADIHKPGHLAWEKKNALEQENIFRTHYSHRSHLEGAGKEPSGRTCVWERPEEASLDLRSSFQGRRGHSQGHTSVKQVQGVVSFWVNLPEAPPWAMTLNEPLASAKVRPQLISMFKPCRALSDIPMSLFLLLSLKRKLTLLLKAVV